MPATGTIHYPSVLNEIVIAYKNPNLIADMALPYIPVMKKTDVYYKFTKQDRFEIPKTVRPHNSVANEIEWGAATATYNCTDEALRFFFADQDYDNADPPVAEMMAQSEILADQLLLSREKRVADLVFASGTYPTANKGQLTAGGTGAGYQLSDYTNSLGKLFGYFETAKNACFYPPNVMIVGPEVDEKVRNHPDVIARINGGATIQNPAAGFMDDVLAKLFGVDKYIVGRAKYNSTPKKAATYSYVWGKDIAFLYVAPTAARYTVTFGGTFLYTPRTGQPGTMPGVQSGWRVRQYRDEERGGGGTFVEVEQYPDEEVICSDVGYLLYDAVA